MASGDLDFPDARELPATAPKLVVETDERWQKEKCSLNVEQVGEQHEELFRHTALGRKERCGRKLSRRTFDATQMDFAGSLRPIRTHWISQIVESGHPFDR